MANNKNTLLTGRFSFKDRIASLMKKDEKNDLDSIASMYPQTMIAEQAVKAALNKHYGLPSDDNNFEETQKTPQETPEEEYVWVEGYKGTDRDMKCRDYQYELGKKFDMPEGAEISICSSGFHLCPELKQVFQYYNIGDGNRFFKVMALVPKEQTEIKINSFFGLDYAVKPEKYAAKEIIFMSECTPDEILATSISAKDFTDEEKLLALEIGIDKVLGKRNVAELTTLGYSEDVAEYILDKGLVREAKVLTTQENISWDARIVALFGRRDD